jgi:hypothetical protein
MSFDVMFPAYLLLRKSFLPLRKICGDGSL